MSKLVHIYRKLERRVSTVRATQKEESTEEATYLDVMDLIWWEMTEEERQTIELRPEEKKATGSL
jgi:hypothetical protein